MRDSAGNRELSVLGEEVVGGRRRRHQSAGERSHMAFVQVVVLVVVVGDVQKVSFLTAGKKSGTNWGTKTVNKYKSELQRGWKWEIGGSVWTSRGGADDDGVGEVGGE